MACGMSEEETIDSFFNISVSSSIVPCGVSYFSPASSFLKRLLSDGFSLSLIISIIS